MICGIVELCQLSGVDGTATLLVAATAGELVGVLDCGSGGSVLGEPVGDAPGEQSGWVVEGGGAAEAVGSGGQRSSVEQ